MNTTAEGLLTRIRSEAETSELKFNEARVRIYDMRELFHETLKSKEPVDKIAFVETMKGCRWNGPYKFSDNNRFFFYSVDSTGKNEFTVGFCIILAPQRTSRSQLNLFYVKNGDMIRSYNSFGNSSLF